MAECLITAGIADTDCDEKFAIPGIKKKIYIANHSEIASFTETTPGEINAITFDSLKGTKELFYKDETGSYQSELFTDASSGLYYNQEISLRVISRTTATRNSIEDMGDVRVVLIIEDSDGVWRLFGETKGIKMTKSLLQSGVVAGDDSGYLLTFSGLNLAEVKEFLDTDKATTDTTLEGYVV